MAGILTELDIDGCQKMVLLACCYFGVQDALTEGFMLSILWNLAVFITHWAC